MPLQSSRQKGHTYRVSASARTRFNLGIQVQHIRGFAKVTPKRNAHRLRCSVAWQYGWLSLKKLNLNHWVNFVMTFKPYYFGWSVLLFLIELYIALYIDDGFIRPYVGDILVVILIYAVVRAFVKVAILPAAVGVLVFSFWIEILQYFKIVEILGLDSSPIARTVIGTTFSWKDILAYTVGFLMVLGFEKFAGIPESKL